MYIYGIYVSMVNYFMLFVYIKILGILFFSTFLNLFSAFKFYSISLNDICTYYLFLGSEIL